MKRRDFLKSCSLATAADALCSDGKMPIIVFDMNQSGNLTRLLRSEKVGTLVHP